MRLFKTRPEVDYKVYASIHSKTWPTRPLARAYKKLLGQIGVKGDIYKREYETGPIKFIRRETKVS